MSNEIKENEDIHSEKEINQDNGEQSQEIDQPLSLPELENEQTEETPANDTQPSSLPEPENEQTEETPANDAQPSLSIDNDSDIPSEKPSTDVVIDEEEVPTGIVASEDIPLEIPTSEDDTNAPVDTIPIEDNNTAVETDQSESSDDTPKLLKIIIDKSNKEANSTILNTVI